ncbi:MmcQ/YjbR family DNA-binding protein [uncultured Dubosiella sp.]|uniref:MmcQ/YjbR family DNA-binding protein n=2 Tax=uncultured Dubosiella sp. TaxID=1937011 RepID=UPI002731804D|nr:MmcQ/YjbR family DNA-binding protein [uncultured Dubosiella sp.]
MEQAWRRKRPVVSKLEAAGFENKNGVWEKRVPIMAGDFELVVRIENDLPSFRVLDVAFGEEYIGYKVTDGEFALRMKEEIERVLKAIAQEAFEDVWFDNAQANRIAHRILEAYGDEPQFLFKNDEQTGVFRNPDNDKWYGIVLARKDKATLLNVKLDKERVKTLLEREGYEPAYHMNKTYWISIRLDDTLPDNEIMERVGESHKLTQTSAKSWVIPSKPSVYDVEKAFRESDTIVWHRKANMQKGDLVFIYLSAPIQQIRFACQVVEADEKDKRMTLRKIKRYDDEFPIERLKENGLLAVRSARHVPKALETLLLEKMRKA